MVKSEHDFTLPRDDWEKAVFENATSFSVVVFSKGVRWRRDTTTFPVAIETARLLPGDRAIVYAITDSGRAVVIPPAKWNECLKLWEAKHK